MRIHVDYELCQGHGVCKGEAPEVFDVDTESRVVVLLPEPPESERERVKLAVQYCPTRALRVEG